MIWLPSTAGGRRPAFRAPAYAFAVLFAACLAAPLPAMAQDAAQTAAPADDPVVARVNGTEVRESDVAAVEEEIGSGIPAMPPEARRDYLITLITDTLLVAQAAEAQGAAETEDFKRRLTFARNRLLSEALLNQEAQGAVTEHAMKEVYEEAAKQMSSEVEVNARHILFRVEDATDEKAGQEAEAKVKAVIDRLKKGEDFAKLASELTEDPSGKENGGDLGYFTKEQMVPEFAEVAFATEPGQISGPIKSAFGWHVLKVEDRRTKPAPEFEQVREQIESFVIRRAQGALVARLREQGKVERVPEAGQPAETEKPAPQ